MHPTTSNACCTPPEVTALILAAGDGQRLGGRPKAFLDYHHDSLLCHALTAVAPFAAHIVVGVRAPDLERAQEQCQRHPCADRVICVAGGATRQQTLHNLLLAAHTPYVLVHEVARPWVTADEFQQLLTSVSEHEAVVLYTRIPVRDSVGLLADGELGEILPRSSLIALQTPHAYQLEVLQEVYARAAAEGWREDSTAALVKRGGHKVHLIEGSPRNVKVTYPEDLAALVSPMAEDVPGTRSTIAIAHAGA